MLEMDQVKGEGSQAPPKRLLTLPRAQPGHPEGLVLHADSGLLVAGREVWEGNGGRNKTTRRKMRKGR